MNVFDDYTRQVVMALNNASVKYLVVGGYAVNYYGYRRTTGDIDIWIAPENGMNKEKLIQAFKSLAIEEEVLNMLSGMDFTKTLVFSDGEEPYKIDFLTQISGVDFNEAWNAKTEAIIDDVPIPFIHLHHLIVSKITTGRLKDKIDIETLQRIQKEQPYK
jgi:predicted nucleotidyltransferase